MLSRSHASPEQLQVPKAPEGLKTHARQFVLIGALVGVTTFALLPLVPGFHSAALSPRIELSVLIGLTAVIIATAWVSIQARRGDSAAGARGNARSITAHGRPEPVVVSSPTEPMREDMFDRERADIAAARSALAEVSFSLASAKAVDVETPAVLPPYSEIDTLTVRIKARRPSGGGQRTMITGEDETVAPYSVALELAKSLSDGGAQTILVDWSPTAEGFARTAGLEMRLGFNDLVRGKASFDDIIQHLPGTRAHAIGSGEPMSGSGQKLDPDFLNLVLDALDEAYDFIIVTGRHNEAKVLFECIEGRFDAGVLVVSPRETATPAEQAGMFLGFEVADIDILHYRRLETSASPIASRIALATRTREIVARRA